jgi:hypothetical protein
MLRTICNASNHYRSLPVAATHSATSLAAAHAALLSALAVQVLLEQPAVNKPSNDDTIDLTPYPT